MKQRQYRQLLLLFASLHVWMFLHAQSLTELQFTHITTKDGLSSQYVRDIFQDSRGLIWICTAQGLNRYDGNRFRIYRHIPGNKNSLPSDDVLNIKEDKAGNFWIGTLNGLSYFEPNENRFTNYMYEAGNSNSIASGRIGEIVIDDSGYIWLGTQNGLQRMDPVTKKISLIELDISNQPTSDINARSIYCLYIDHQKQIWVNAGGVLYRVNQSKGNRITTAVVNTQYNQVNAIYQDRQGNYWLSFWGRGFVKYDGVHPPQKNEFISDPAIYFRFAEWKDANGNNWLVITKDDGVSFYNPATGFIKTYQHNNSKPNSIGLYGTSTLMTDRDNNVWIAGHLQLELLEPAKQFFEYHWLNKEEQDVFYGTPLPIYRDGNYYWTGLWHTKGLLKTDSNWIPLKSYKTIPPSSTSANDQTIYSIYKDSSRQFWFSTDDGLVKMNEASNRFSKYQPADTSSGSLEFRKILPLTNNRLLIRTRHKGIYLFNMLSGVFERHLCIKYTRNFLSDDVSDMLLDNDGMLWLATSNGVCSIDTTSFTVKEVLQAGNNNHSLIHNFCRSIDISTDNILWIGTFGGLCRYHIRRKEISSFTTADGLCSNVIGKIAVDKNNNVWAETENGLTFFRNSTGRFTNFYKEDGMPQNNINGTINKDPDGRLYISDIGLVISIDPDKVPENKTQPPVIITDVFADDKLIPVHLNSKHEKQVEALSGSSSVEVHFAVLNFNSPSLNRYYYRLDGIDKNWHISDRGIAAYNNLPPGNYTLNIKGSNNSGVMNEKGDFIRIAVLPRWFETWWFRFLMITFAAALVILFVRWRIRSVKKHALLQQLIAETRMQALRAQMNPHFLFNSLNSIENFIMQNEKRLASDYLNKFSRLIRSILDSSREEMVPVSKDMEALQLYIDLQLLRLNNKFRYESVIDPVLLQGDYKVPSLLIQPFVENAIEHGLAHSNHNDLLLKINAAAQGDMIVYIIEDNGIGREQSARYNHQNRPYHKSTGLSISTDRLKILNKEISGDEYLTIEDLYNDKGEAAGTKVTIKIRMQ